VAERSRHLAAGADYRPFLILSDARTGSTLLAQALNSHAEIICFGEVFNFVVDFIAYEVEGYDPHSAADKALRARDPLEFLRERLYCAHSGAKAVGFKFHYRHFWGHEGLWEALSADTPIHVIHLTRRNQLRMCVSRRIADATGVWREDVQAPAQQVSALARKLTPSRVIGALRRPAQAVASVRRTVNPIPLHQQAEREPVTISEQELNQFFKESDLQVAQFAKLFKDHPTLSITYEEMISDLDGTFAEAQEFLGVEPQRLRVANRKQNPEPLRHLLANYDGLRAAFRDHSNAWMFDG